VLSLLLDLDLLINLFFIYSKKLPLIDAIIVTGISAIILYAYITFKDKKTNSS